MSSNYITKVAIIGAGGNSGSYMTKSLLETGKHTVTAITRHDSTTKLPEGVIPAKVDYSKPQTIVEALKGQDAFIITLGVSATKDVDQMLVQAAADAGVPWILPNEWGPDNEDEGVRRDVPGFASKKEIRDLIKSIGKSSYLSVICGFWYEWSIAIPPAWGFDFANKTVTFVDDGETKISISTWPQVGRAVAAILSLPIKPEGGNPKASLEHFRNNSVYFNSFTVSQRDMLDSVLRVTGDKESDWTITKEPAQERFDQAQKDMFGGSREGFVKTMYTRIFFQDGVGNYEKSKGLSNDILDLPKENIDEATAAGIERAKKPLWADAH